MEELELNDLIEAYDSMIGKVLKSTKVKKRNPNYQDLFQELRIKIYEMAVNCRSSAEFKTRYTDSYIFCRLKWRAKNLVRLIKDETPVEIVENESNQEEDCTAEQSFTDYCDLMSVERFRQKMSKTEARYLAELILDSTKGHLTKQQRSRFRKRLKEYEPNIRGLIQETREELNKDE